MSDSEESMLEIANDPMVPTGFEPGSGLLVSNIGPELAAEARSDAEIDA